MGHFHCVYSEPVKRDADKRNGLGACERVSE